MATTQGREGTAPGWRTTDIEGVVLRSNATFTDVRGSFSELWRGSLSDPLGFDPFVQCNLSRSRSGVLRGMHVHRRQADLWLVIEGTAVAATTDLRQLVAGRPDGPLTQTLDLQPGDALFLPPLVAHGFLASTDVALLYLVTREYDGQDEFGFAWDDPGAAIPWPDGQPILSDRDVANPSLADAVAALLGSSHSSER